MSFRKYNSIENSYRDKTIEKIKLLGYGGKNVEWMVTEKIHGANFQISYDGEFVKFSSRNNVLDDDDNFYGYHIIMEELSASVVELNNDLLELDPSITNIRVYGELFGGGYNHPDVKKQNRKQVQKGVQYTPNIEFYAIDIFIEFGKGKENYLDSYTAMQNLDNYFFTAKPLFRGTLDECLEYKNEYQTTIPALLGLPEIENNICEGNVIKPVDSCWFPHSDPEQASRIILKNKNDKFSEKNDKKKERVEVVLSELGNKALNEALSYVNENRYNNVISKIGDIDYDDTSNIGKLIGMMIKDTMQDFSKDFATDTISKPERGKIQKIVTAEVRNIVLSKF